MEIARNPLKYIFWLRKFLFDWLTENYYKCSSSFSAFDIHNEVSIDVCNLKSTSSSILFSKPIASDVDWFVIRIHAQPMMNLSNLHKQTSSRYSSKIINGFVGNWVENVWQKKETNVISFVLMGNVNARFFVVVILVPFLFCRCTLSWAPTRNDCREFTLTMLFLSFPLSAGDCWLSLLFWLGTLFRFLFAVLIDYQDTPWKDMRSSKSHAQVTLLTSIKALFSTVSTLISRSSNMFSDVQKARLESSLIAMKNRIWFSW